MSEAVQPGTNVSTFSPGRPAPTFRAQMRRGVRNLGVRAFETVGSGLRRLLGRRPGAGFGILTYHRVIPWNGQAPAPTWNVTPERLRIQLEGLLAGGYQPWSLPRVLACEGAGQPIPDRVFVVTFDDGFENVYLNAWPILRELGIPATIFLATAYLDSQTPFPFEDWPLASTSGAPSVGWRPLSTAQCHEMQAEGTIDFGSHTHTHANFRGQPVPFAKDLATSLEVLRTRFRMSEVPFSFPFGIADADLLAVTRQAGVQCALSTNASLVRPGSDPFTWGRFGIEERDSPSAVATRLDGWYGLARGAWLRIMQPERSRAASLSGEGKP